MNVEPVVCPGCGAAGGRPVGSGIDYEYRTSSRSFTFLGCDRCDLLYLNPRPAADALELIYPSTYYSFTPEGEGGGIVGALWASWERRKARDYTRHLGPGPRRILDVGCGRGRLLSILKSVGPPAWSFHGIELDGEAVDAVRRLGFSAERTTIENYDPPERFDLIVLQQVIEHVRDPKAVARGLARLLAPGGVVVLETPDLAGWDYGLFRRGLWGGYHFPRHWTLFSGTSLRRLMEEAGLQVVEQKSLMSLSFWAWSVHHALLRLGFPAWALRALRAPSFLLLPPAVVLETLQLLVGRKTSNQRLVARKP